MWARFGSRLVSHEAYGPPDETAPNLIGTSSSMGLTIESWNRPLCPKKSKGRNVCPIQLEVQVLTGRESLRNSRTNNRPILVG